MFCRVRILEQMEEPSAGGKAGQAIWNVSFFKNEKREREKTKRLIGIAKRFEDQEETFKSLFSLPFPRSPIVNYAPKSNRPPVRRCARSCQLKLDCKKNAKNMKAIILLWQVDASEVGTDSSGPQKIPRPPLLKGEKAAARAICQSRNNKFRQFFEKGRPSRIFKPPSKKFSPFLEFVDSYCPLRFAPIVPFVATG